MRLPLRQDYTAAEDASRVWLLRSAFALTSQDVISPTDCLVYHVLIDAAYSLLPSPTPIRIAEHSDNQIPKAEAAESIVRLGYIGMLPIPDPKVVLTEDVLDQIQIGWTKLTIEVFGEISKGTVRKFRDELATIRAEIFP